MCLNRPLTKTQKNSVRECLRKNNDRLVKTFLLLQLADHRAALTYFEVLCLQFSYRRKRLTPPLTQSSADNILFRTSFSSVVRQF